MCLGHKGWWQIYRFTHGFARQEDASANLPWTEVVADAA